MCRAPIPGEILATFVFLAATMERTAVWKSAWFCRNFSRCHANRVLRSGMPFYDCREREEEISSDSLLFFRARSFVYIEKANAQAKAPSAHRARIVGRCNRNRADFLDESPFTLRPLCVSLPGFLAASTTHCPLEPTDRSRTQGKVLHSRFFRMRMPLSKDKWIIGL